MSFCVLFGLQSQNILANSKQLGLDIDINLSVSFRDNGKVAGDANEQPGSGQSIHDIMMNVSTEEGSNDHAEMPTGSGRNGKEPLPVSSATSIWSATTLAIPISAALAVPLFFF